MERQKGENAEKLDRESKGGRFISIHLEVIFVKKRSKIGMWQFIYLLSLFTMVFLSDFKIDHPFLLLKHLILFNNKKVRLKFKRWLLRKV